MLTSEALAAFRRSMARGVRCSARARSRTSTRRRSGQRRGDAALADRLRPGTRLTGAGSSSRATPSSSASPSASATGCTGVWATAGPSARRTQRIRGALRRQRGGARRRCSGRATWWSSTIRRRPDAARPPGRGRRPADLARTHRLDLPNDVAREDWRFLSPISVRRHVHVLARGLHVEGPRPCTGVRHPAVDRRLLSQEPRDSAHQRHRGSGHSGPGRRRPPAASGDLRAPRRRHRLRPATQRRWWRRRSTSRRPATGGGSRWDALKDPLGVLADVRRARARGGGAASRAGGPGRPAPSRTIRRAPGSSPSRGSLARPCPRTCVAAFTSRCCRCRTPRRTP